MDQRPRPSRRARRRRRRLLMVILPISAVLLSVPLALWAFYARETAISHDGLLPVQTDITQTLNDADKALKGGNANLALSLVRHAVQLAPSDGQARAQLGIRLQALGQLVAAERELRRAINPIETNDPHYDLVQPYLLRVMFQRHEYKELLEEFPDPPRELQDRSKVAPDILSIRAFALQALNRTAEARSAMDRSLALRRDVEGLLSSALLAARQDNLELARSQTDEAIALSPTDEGAWFRALQLARESGDLRQALARADEWVARIPSSVNAKIFRIDLLLQLKEYTRAKQDVDVVLKAAPRTGQLYDGILMARAGDFQGAWHRLQPLPPEFVQADPLRARTVASIAASSGRVNIGEAILTTFVAKNPDDQVARLQLAASRLSKNSPQASLEVLSPTKVSDPAVHALLAQTYLRLKQFNEAFSSLEKVSALPKKSNLLKENITAPRTHVGEFDEIWGLQAILDNDPNDVVIAAPLIAALIARSNWDDALEIADGMAKRAPKSPFPNFYEGQVLVARGDLIGSDGAFSKALAIDPNFVPALYYRANVSAARGDIEAAKKDLQRLRAQNPGIVLANIRIGE